MLYGFELALLMLFREAMRCSTLVPLLPLKSHDHPGASPLRLPGFFLILYSSVNGFSIRSGSMLAVSPVIFTISLSTFLSSLYAVL